MERWFLHADNIRTLASSEESIDRKVSLATKLVDENIRKAQSAHTMAVFQGDICPLSSNTVHAGVVCDAHTAVWDRELNSGGTSVAKASRLV